LPAIKQVLKPGELEGIEISAVDDPSPGCIAIRVRMCGEYLDDLLIDARVQPEPPSAEFLDRFVSNLGDFVAESRFGWGQDRPKGPNS
jgi:hypothetical protein